MFVCHLFWNTFNGTTPEKEFEDTEEQYLKMPLSQFILAQKLVLLTSQLLEGNKKTNVELGKYVFFIT